MEDIKFSTKGFWYPNEVAALAGVEGLECSTGDGWVIVHPRPRELSEKELEALRLALAEQEKPNAETIESEYAAAKERRDEDLREILRGIDFDDPNLKNSDIRKALKALARLMGVIDA